MAMEEDAGRGYCYASRESTLKTHAVRGQLSHPSTHCLLVPFYGGGLGWFPTAHVEGAPLYMFLPSSLVVPPGRAAVAGPTAAVERGPSEGARSGSKGPARVPFPRPLRFPSFPIARRIHARRPCNEYNLIRP